MNGQILEPCRSAAKAAWIYAALLALCFSATLAQTINTTPAHCGSINCPMNRKNVLAVSTIFIIAIGTILALTPFVGSLKPNAPADAALPRFEISKLEIGKISVLDGPSLGEVLNGYELKLLGYRTADGEIKIWRVPVKNGKIGMPDIHWRRPIHDCTQLSIIEQDDNAIISCLDSDISDWWANEWRWDINGVNLGKMVDDLEVAKGVVEGGYFAYAKSS